jgi:hypothetical protein
VRCNCGRQKQGEAMRPEKQRSKSLVLKRNVRLNERMTCISLENAFWDANGCRTRPMSSLGRQLSRPSADSSTRAALPFSPSRSIRRARRYPSNARCYC